MYIYEKITIFRHLELENAFAILAAKHKFTLDPDITFYCTDRHKYINVIDSKTSQLDLRVMCINNESIIKIK